MVADGSELSTEEGGGGPARPPRSRPYRFALGCLFFLTTACVLVCGIAGYGIKRHGDDVARHAPAPMPDPSTESDPDFRILAEVRRALGTRPVDDCSRLETALDAELAEFDAARAEAFYAFVRARLEELDTQALREVCQIAGYGACSDETFLAFRAYLLAMGRPTFELARADDDEALARILPRAPYCFSFAESSYGAAVRATQGADAGIAGPTRIEPSRRTHVLERSRLPRAHPRMCRRFTCTYRDVLD